MVPECKPEWNREAITVFSRLPSLRRLQSTPLLQTSLIEIAYGILLLFSNQKLRSTKKSFQDHCEMAQCSGSEQRMSS